MSRKIVRAVPSLGRECIVFILLVVAVSPIAAISQQKACVQGVVLDDKGAPVPDVRVSLQPLPPKPLLKGVGTTHSGAQGEFHIADLEAGEYWIITSKPSDGYPDTLAAIYGEGRAPKTSLTASTICSVVTVNLGPKAARLEIDALHADDHTHVSNPRFKLVKVSTGAWTSGSADQDILIPAHTRVSIEITADGYRSSDAIVLDGLHPDENRHLTVGLQPLGGTQSRTSATSLQGECVRWNPQTDTPPPDELTAFLQQKDVSSREPDCVIAALQILGREQAKEAIPQIIDFLAFRRKFYWEGTGFKMQPVIEIDHYPAALALFEIGKPALPALLSVIVQHPPESLEFRNAVNTIMLIHRDTPPDGVRFLHRAALIEEDQMRRANLDAAVILSASFCARQSQPECRAAGQEQANKTANSK